MARSPSPSSPKRRRLTTPSRVSNRLATPSAGVAFRRSTPTRLPPIPSTAVSAHARDQALNAMGSAKRDIDYFTEKIASTKESLVAFHEATAVYSADVDSLQAEIDALQSELKIAQANLTKAQAGSVACETNLPAFEHCQAAARMAYAAAHDTVRRMDRAGAPTVGPTPSQAQTERTTTYDEDGIDSMEAGCSSVSCDLLFGRIHALFAFLPSRDGEECPTRRLPCFR